MDHVKRLHDDARQVEREALALAAETAGLIRLGVFWTLAPFYAAGLIRSFAEAAPGVVIRQQELSLVQLAGRLREGSPDFAVTCGQGAPAEGLAFAPLAELRPMIVVARDHPLAGRGSAALPELAHEPCVMFDAPGSRSYFEDLLASGGISPGVAYASTSMEAVRCAVAAGFGFTLLVMRPPSPVTYDGGEVRTLQIRGDLRPLRLVLASRAGAHSGRIARRFAEHTAAYFAARRHPAGA